MASNYDVRNRYRWVHTDPDPLPQCGAVHPRRGLPCTLDRGHDGVLGHACIVPTPFGEAHDVARWL